MSKDFFFPPCHRDTPSGVPRPKTSRKKKDTVRNVQTLRGTRNSTHHFENSVVIFLERKAKAPLCNNLAIQANEGILGHGINTWY